VLGGTTVSGRRETRSRPGPRGPGRSVRAPVGARRAQSCARGAFEVTRGSRDNGREDRSLKVFRRLTRRFSLGRHVIHTVPSRTKYRWPPYRASMRRLLVESRATPERCESPPHLFARGLDNLDFGHDTTRSQFSRPISWGTSTSGYQTEGGGSNTDWWRYERAEGTTVLK